MSVAECKIDQPVMSAGAANKIPGIPKYSNFSLTSKSMCVWEAYNFGEGMDIEGSGSEQDVSGLERIVDWLPFSFQNFDFFLLGHQYKHHHLYQMQQRHQLLTCHDFAPHQATPEICIMKLVWINNILNKNSNCK